MAPQHPEWKTQEPFKTLLAGDVKGVLAAGREGDHATILAATHTGMTTEEFDEERRATGRPPPSTRAPAVSTPRWSTSRCSSCWPTCAPTASRPSSCRGAGSSSCGPGSRRSTASRPSRSWAAAGHEVRDAADGPRAASRRPKIEFVDDGPGKPVGINRFIGRRPILAFGNSDGDHQMLQWTAAGAGRTLHGDRPPHRRRARVGLRPHVPHRQARQGAGTRRWPRAGRWWT